MQLSVQRVMRSVHHVATDIMLPFPFQSLHGQLLGYMIQQAQGITWACACLSVGLVASCALAAIVAHQALGALLVHGCAVSTHVAWWALAEELICQALNLRYDQRL
jgi:hypothetical protein